jgi:CARDB
LPDIDWLQLSFVSQRIARVRTGTAGRGNEAATPGLHGNGIVGASLGGQTLTAGGTTTIPLSGDLSFSVQVANQGENTETDVPVNVTVGSGDSKIDADSTLDSIAAGETKTVEIPLGGEPPTGQTVPIEIEVQAVPGEEKTDNNKQSFSAIFTK